ncbi:unnamed protein product [Acanthoscelides obtectus]|uniref:Uncharacterized protein n=1 Tax=Acanthoscelides obtectus TaxID=200917 RepID=A0A9P0K2V6_ACAOB|nr:unnamed protein product [Acanthoscelides obtectus]CAK1663950.1 hypothetical protein AOBTE_LOCUS23953 [Acanthoscelides obtectus]
MWLEEVGHNRRYISTSVFFCASIMGIRAIVRSRNISHTPVHTILRSENMHPYHVQRVHEFIPSDYAHRVEFCENML